jgi:hypothetical protein
MGQAAFEPGDEAYVWEVALTLDDSDGLLESDGGRGGAFSAAFSSY